MKDFALKVCAVIFFIVGLGHLLRLMRRMPIMIGGYDVPMRVSIFGCVIPFALAVWLITVIRKK